MILVDSSVWIDYFNGVANRETDLLDRLLGYEEVLLGDLILAEVLQGFQKDRDFKRAQALMTALTTVDLGGVAIAVKAASTASELSKIAGSEPSRTSILRPTPRRDSSSSTNSTRCPAPRASS